MNSTAARPDAKRFKQLRITLKWASNRLDQRMHRQGVFHQHTPLHHHDSRNHEV